MSKRARRSPFLPPDAKVYYKGKWVPASEVVPKRERKIDIARSELARRVVSEVLKSPNSCIERSKLMELAEEVSAEIGLKRRVSYRFLIAEGILGRVRGSKSYFLTEKAKELFPELFKQEA
ncbi:MAG: hypothetical protein J7L11_03245 [Thermoprotei archaeon]|nr:hypothetical protein [Thermoprotei archaeon]